jgi:hypothetical protein
MRIDFSDFYVIIVNNQSVNFCLWQFQKNAPQKEKEI